MYYKLVNPSTKATMFYDELSDWLLAKGWRIEREAKASEVDPFEMQAVEHDIMEEMMQ
jgi:hypothetical protein